jgi:lipoprotein-releasing system permease protein
MNTELFIARRIYRGDKKNDKLVSSPAIKIAIAGISVGLAVMILAVSIVVGFKREVREAVVSFGSHIQITAFDSGGSSFEHTPIAFSDALAVKLMANPEIRHIQEFITKPAVIKTDDDFQGIVLKGISESFYWDFFQRNLVEGSIINPNDSTAGNQIIISRTTANRLRLNLGDSFNTYFVQDQPRVRVRRFTIVGIYETNFESHDRLFALVEMPVLARLNGWDDDMVSGIEVLVHNFSRLDRITRDLFFELATYRDRLGSSLHTLSIKDINPMIFNWLDLLDMNVWVIIGLMLIVSGFMMISGLLIIILERTNMIGMLKSMGARDFSIRKVFLYLSAFLIAKGMLWGNVIALTICIIQDQFQIVRLNPAVYYVSAVPIDLNPLHIILLNIGTLTVSLLMMIVPSLLVAKITPAKSIKFE